MRALCLTGYGFNIRKKLKFLDIEDRTPGPDDILISVKAAGLNPVDYKFIYGMAIILSNPPRPYPLGFDVAGTVVSKGGNVHDFSVGDEVYSKVPWDQMGTLCEFAVIRSDMAAMKPKNSSFSEAAGLPLVGCTVYDAFKAGGVHKGTKILILGGSGGNGTFAIQYAKYLGAIVYTTTSTSNIELLKSLGADHVIDYKKNDFRKVVKDMDVVFDTLGGKYVGQSLNSVRKGGKIISIAGHHDDQTLKNVGISFVVRVLFALKGSILMLRMRLHHVHYKHVWSYPNKSKLNEIRYLVENGWIKPVVDRIYSFEESIDALCYLKTRRAKGKVIVSMEKEKTNKVYNTK